MVFAISSLASEINTTLSPIAYTILPSDVQEASFIIKLLLIDKVEESIRSLL